MAKVQRDWLAYKQEIVEVIGKAELKVEERLALEVKLGNRKNMNQMKERTQTLEREESNQQQVIGNLSNVVKLIGQDIVGHYKNIQVIFNQLVSYGNKQRKNNVRLKEKAESTNLPDGWMDLFESIIGSEATETLKIDSAFRIGLYKNAARPRDIWIKFVYWNPEKLIMSITFINLEI